MKRLFTALAVIGLVAALGAPVFAAELKASGRIKVKHIATTEGTSSGTSYIKKDMKTRRLTTMRANPTLQFLANEYAGFVWTGEIDIDWGDAAYNRNEASGTAGAQALGSSSGNGGGLAADTVNIETKNLYLHFDIPETPISFRAGILGNSDTFSYVVSVTDTAGFYALVDLGDTRINANWVRWWDPNEASIVDDVDMFMLTASQKLPAANATVGASAYYLKDGSGQAGNGVLQKGMSNKGNLGWLTYNAATGFSPIIPTSVGGTTVKYTLDAYYLGLFGNAVVGPVKLDGWALYNFGTVDVTAGPDSEDIDISAFALDLQVSTKIQGVSLSLEGLYVSGDDKQVGDGDFGLITANQYQLAGAFYLRHGMMILLCDPDDINNSTALAYDPANIYENTYLGVMGIFANASVGLPMNLNAKVGLGYLASAEDRLVNGNTAMGTELNGKLTYTVTKGLTIDLNGAYVWTGDFYEVTPAEAAAYNAKVAAGDLIGGNLSANEDPDNVWYTSLVATLSL